MRHHAPEREERGCGDPPTRLQATDHLWFLPCTDGPAPRTLVRLDGGRPPPGATSRLFGGRNPSSPGVDISRDGVMPHPQDEGDRAPPMAAYGVGAVPRTWWSQVVEFSGGNRTDARQRSAPGRRGSRCRPLRCCPEQGRPDRPYRGHGMGARLGPGRRRVRHGDGRHAGRRRAARRGRRHHGHQPGPPPGLSASTPSPCCLRQIRSARPRYCRTCRRSARRPRRPPPRPPHRRPARAASSPRSPGPSCARPSSPRTPRTSAPPPPSGRRSPRSGFRTSGAATGPPTATPASTARA